MILTLVDLKDIVKGSNFIELTGRNFLLCETKDVNKFKNQILFDIYTHLCTWSNTDITVFIPEKIHVLLRDMDIRELKQSLFIDLINKEFDEVLIRNNYAEF